MDIQDAETEPPVGLDQHHGELAIMLDGANLAHGIPIKVDTAPAGYMVDGKGSLVPEQNVSALDKLRNEMVNRLAGRAISRSLELTSVKEWVLSEIDAFLELSAQQYGVSLGGKKGNITLYSFDQQYRITIQVADRISFDERLQVAKVLIDECIREWGADARSELMTLINDAFQVDKEGKVSTTRVLGLRRHEIKDEKWTKAMQAIGDSMLTVGSKRYVRFYTRIGKSDDYQPILLDFSKL